jgi:GAG-pre-integrase domain
MKYNDRSNVNEHIFEMMNTASKCLGHISEIQLHFDTKCLGHISRQRITRLVQSEILRHLNMSDLGLCIECAKGKQISMRKYTVNCMTYVLELIHTNICGPFPTTTSNGHVYFISFIDDYSRYDYIYLIKENG